MGILAAKTLTMDQQLIMLVFIVIGAAVAFWLTSHISLEPVRWILNIIIVLIAFERLLSLF